MKDLMNKVIEAKKAAGYFTTGTVLDEDGLLSVKGRDYL